MGAGASSRELQPRVISSGPTRAILMPDDDDDYEEEEEGFLCPITRELMRDPVFCADGHSYERSYIEEWLRTHKTSPLTNTRLAHKQLVPNHALRGIINERRERRLAQPASTPPSAPVAEDEAQPPGANREAQSRQAWRSNSLSALTRSKSISP